MQKESNLNTTDHVLLEWWLAYTLYNIPGYPVYRIVPIFCGTVSLADIPPLKTDRIFRFRRIRAENPSSVTSFENSTYHNYLIKLTDPLKHD